MLVSVRTGQVPLQQQTWVTLIWNCSAAVGKCLPALWFLIYFRLLRSLIFIGRQILFCGAVIKELAVKGIVWEKRQSPEALGGSNNEIICLLLLTRAEADVAKILQHN